MTLNLNNISFKQINTFIHVYHIPYLHDYLLSFKEYFIFEFKKFKEVTENLGDYDGNNLILSEEKIYKIFETIINKHYIVDSNWEVGKNIGIYLQIQTPKSNKNTYHNHTPSAIAATTYINPPLENEGGELQLYLHEHQQVKLSLEKDCLYFFPGWMMHRPLPQNTTKERICINWSYDSSKRPIHKLTGDRW